MLCLSGFELYSRWVPMTPSLASFQKYDEGIQSQIEVDDRLWTSNASFVACLFQNSDVSAKEYANL